MSNLLDDLEQNPFKGYHKWKKNAFKLIFGGLAFFFAALSIPWWFSEMAFAGLFGLEARWAVPILLVLLGSSGFVFLLGCYRWIRYFWAKYNYEKQS